MEPLEPVRDGGQRVGGGDRREVAAGGTARLRLAAGLLLLVVAGCGRPSPGLVDVPAGGYPLFVDDADRTSLIRAVDRHLAYLDRQPDAGPQRIGGAAVDNRTLADGLAAFRRMVAATADPLELGRLIRGRYRLVQAAGRSSEREMLVTGYFEPTFAGSLSETKRYRHPLHRVPDSLVVRGTGDARRVGRLDADGRLVPFWSREEIVSGRLLQDDEIVYLADRMDAYLLQIQGSGRIRLPDGSLRSIRFAGSNGRAYRSLGKLFVDRGIMSRDEVSVSSMRAWLADHPEEIDAMLFHNPRYIFFAWGDDRGPRGSLGEILTAGRSIAVDHGVLPSGCVGYLVSRRPVLDARGAIDRWRPFARFVVPQDSGAAISGSGRVDLFLGNTAYAQTAAGSMQEPGTLYFLVPKNTETTPQTR